MRCFCRLAVIGPLAAALALLGTTTVAGATSSGAPVKVMIIGSFNGLGVNLAEQDAGAEAAVTAINHAGGVNGHPIALTSCNDQFSDSDAQACARQAVSGNYAAVLGGFSATSESYVAVLAAGGVPLVGAFSDFASAGYDPILTSTDSYPITGGFPGLAIGVGALAAQKGYHKVNVLALNSPNATLVAHLVAQGMRAHGGGSVGQIVKMPLGAADASPYSSALLQGDPKAVVIYTDGNDTARVIQGIRESGSMIPIVVASTSLDKQVISTLGSSANGLLFATWFELPGSSSANEKAFEKELHGADPSAAQDDLSDNAWASVYAFAQVASKLHVINASTVGAAFKHASGIDLKIGPVVSIGGTPVAGIPRLYNDQVMFGVLQNGQEKAVSKGFVAAVGTK